MVGTGCVRIVGLASIFVGLAACGAPPGDAEESASSTAAVKVTTTCTLLAGIDHTAIAGRAAPVRSVFRYPVGSIGAARYAAFITEVAGAAPSYWAVSDSQ